MDLSRTIAGVGKSGDVAPVDAERGQGRSDRRSLAWVTRRRERIDQVAADVDGDQPEPLVAVGRAIPRLASNWAKAGSSVKRQSPRRVALPPLPEQSSRPASRTMAKRKGRVPPARNPDLIQADEVGRRKAASTNCCS